MLLEAEVGRDDPAAIAVHGVTARTLGALVETLPAIGAVYVQACGYKADSGQVLLVPGPTGALACVLLGVGADQERDPFAAGRLPGLLPDGVYSLAAGFDDPFLAALAFELGAYKFSRADRLPPLGPRLLVPHGVDLQRVTLIARATELGRDLVNRPANDLGPEALEEAARACAEAHGARVEAIRGDALLSENLPMIHAVGRAAAEAPRLVDMRWGDADAPKVTLVGKGVCFDTGGLDIKPEAAMLLMRKDMGGAAAALALAAMIMGARLPVRLRVLLPIVENSIAGNAYRPGDILTSRKGLTVEVGNTDAEGRLILADALSLADEEAPDLLFDFATLTGAARVALGPDLPPFYTTDDALADTIAHHAATTNDPAWRMPLWAPYDTLLKGKVADLSNVSGGSFAGSITAALFLRRFVERSPGWAHFDIYGWNPSSRPGRPEGGEVQMARALFALVEERFGGRGTDQDRTT